MSYNLFCHNVKKLTTCTNMEPGESEVELELLWASSVTTTSGSSTLDAATTNQGAFQNWLLCKDDTILLNDIVETTYDRSQLLKSTDFGANWSVVTQPFDDVWDGYDSAGYATIYGHSRVHRMFWMQDGSLGVAAGYTPGSGGQSYSCFTSGDLGTTWTLRNSGVSTSGASTDAADPRGSYTKAISYGFTCGHNSDKSRILFGGRPSQADAGYMILPPGHTSEPASTTPNSELVMVATNIGAGSPDSNTTSITQLNTGWVYQTRGSANAIWATDHAAAQGYYRVSSIYYDAGFPTWRATFTGSWRSVYQYGNWFTNGWYFSAPLGLAQYSWQTNGYDLLVPATNYNVDGNAAFAIYYSIGGLDNITPTEIDYSSLVVPVDVADTTTKHAFKLFYVESINRWVMVYSFKRAASADPLWMYMRVGGLGFEASEFGSPQKLNFPTGYELRGSGNGAVQVDYSVINAKWLFATYVKDTAPAPDVYRAALWTVDDNFYCP